MFVYPTFPIIGRLKTNCRLFFVCILKQQTSVRTDVIEIKTTLRGSPLPKPQKMKLETDFDLFKSENSL